MHFAFLQTLKHVLVALSLSSAFCPSKVAIVTSCLDHAVFLTVQHCFCQHNFTFSGALVSESFSFSSLGDLELLTSKQPHRVVVKLN